MVYKFFDKEFSGSSAKSETMPNQELAEEWHKPVIRKFEKQKVCSSFKDNIWGANLVEIQLISKNKKGFCLSIYVIDIYGKYSWFVPLKDKQVIAIANRFKKILDESGREPNKIRLDKAVNITMNW